MSLLQKNNSNRNSNSKKDYNNQKVYSKYNSMNIKIRVAETVVSRLIKILKNIKIVISLEVIFLLNSQKQI